MPVAMPKLSPSAKARRLPTTTTLMMSLPSAPEPTGPRWYTRRLNVRSNGSASRTSASAPPTSATTSLSMTVLPVPLTDASMKRRPASDSSSAKALDCSGKEVEVSMTI